MIAAEKAPSRRMFSLMDEITVGIGVFKNASIDLDAWYRDAPTHLQKVPIIYNGRFSHNALLSKEWSDLKARIDEAFEETRRILEKFGGEATEIAHQRLKSILTDKMDPLGVSTVHSIDPNYRFFYEHRNAAEFLHRNEGSSVSASRYSFLLGRSQEIYAGLLREKRKITEELEEVRDQIDALISGPYTLSWIQPDYIEVRNHFFSLESAARKVKAKSKTRELMRKLYGATQKDYVNVIDRSFLSSFKSLDHKKVVAEARGSREVLLALLSSNRHFESGEGR